VRRVALLAVVVASLGAAGPGPARAGCNANQAWQDRFPAWSPTGGAIAFMRQQVGCDPPPESLGIFQSGHAEEIIGADGAQGSWASPSWSPNGLAVALGSIRGMDVRNLSRSTLGDDRMPAWHGDTIAFISNRDRSPLDLYGFALYTMSSDGSNQRWRAADLHPYSGLSWSPDGSQIAFASGRECFRWGIYVIDLQTESVRRVTNQCTFTGTARNDILTGTPFQDYLNGGAGNDRLYGLGREDRLRGDYGNDSLYGGPGADLLLGGGGRNTVRGGNGNDRIESDPRGHDRIFGGGGNDLIESGSGSRDVVSCGPGRDTVVADRVDRVGRDCEHVRRI
jgi:RTX calcium-binding nonapeptide repeat (4 copies)/WD40-like Beta Propeller Repeat